MNGTKLVFMVFNCDRSEYIKCQLKSEPIQLNRNLYDIYQSI
jgi:hypothetical protein